MRDNNIETEFYGLSSWATGAHTLGQWAEEQGRQGDSLLQVGSVSLHCPLARHWDLAAPSAMYPGLQMNLTASLRLNWLP